MNARAPEISDERLAEICRAHEELSDCSPRFVPEPPLRIVDRFSDGTPFILDARGRLVDPPRCECRR